MNKIMEFVKTFITEEDGSTTSEYGSLYLLTAIALFIVFAALQGGLISAVHTIAGEFCSKMDSLSLANNGHQL